MCILSESTRRSGSAASFAPSAARFRPSIWSEAKAERIASRTIGNGLVLSAIGRLERSSAAVHRYAGLRSTASMATSLRLVLVVASIPIRWNHAFMKLLTGHPWVLQQRLVTLPHGKRLQLREWSLLVASVGEIDIRPQHRQVAPVDLTVRIARLSTSVDAR